MFILQHLWSRWTKLSRPASAGRPQLPAALPLGQAPSGPAWLHGVCWLEEDGFKERQLHEPLTARGWRHNALHHPANLSWRHSGPKVLVTLLHPSPYRLTTHWPASLPSPLLTLDVGDIAKIQWNGRFHASLFGSNRSYLYAEHAFWLANVETPGDGLFLNAESAKTIDLRTRIY